ncbi:hypothetical protein NDU88_009530 [Pleurodeles waltl]|uniref:Uncharacterized protein n=1 Tax=Pleurodeles waltl TaxID=8319 RepID=A0AAV7PSR2_PLEWA|nr:hypothetical protein NDU88_009530 [Pleurodeles waltl]
MLSDYRRRSLKTPPDYQRAGEAIFTSSLLLPSRLCSAIPGATTNAWPWPAPSWAACTEQPGTGLSVGRASLLTCAADIFSRAHDPGCTCLTLTYLLRTARSTLGGWCSGAAPCQAQGGARPGAHRSLAAEDHPSPKITEGLNMAKRSSDHGARTGARRLREPR